MGEKVFTRGRTYPEEEKEEEEEEGTSKDELFDRARNS